MNFAGKQKKKVTRKQIKSEEVERDKTKTDTYYFCMVVGFRQVATYIILLAVGTVLVKFLNEKSQLERFLEK